MNIELFVTAEEYKYDNRMADIFAKRIWNIKSIADIDNVEFTQEDEEKVKLVIYMKNSVRLGGYIYYNGAQFDVNIYFKPNCYNIQKIYKTILYFVVSIFPEVSQIEDFDTNQIFDKDFINDVLHRYTDFLPLTRMYSIKAETVGKNVTLYRTLGLNRFNMSEMAVISSSSGGLSDNLIKVLNFAASQAISDKDFREGKEPRLAGINEHSGFKLPVVITPLSSLPGWGAYNAAIRHSCCNSLSLGVYCTVNDYKEKNARSIAEFEAEINKRDFMITLPEITVHNYRRISKESIGLMINLVKKGVYMTGFFSELSAREMMKYTTGKFAYHIKEYNEKTESFLVENDEGEETVFSEKLLFWWQYKNRIGSTVSPLNMPYSQLLISCSNPESEEIPALK